MNILYFGDVFGKPGRDALQKVIPKLRAQYAIHYIIANVENAAHGRGLLPKMADDFFEWGIDCLTTGNHAWDQSSIIERMDVDERILRPANYPDGEYVQTPGRGVVLLKKFPGHEPLAICQFMGRVFMEAIDCPFQKGMEVVERLRNAGVRCIFVDFHGEASSEKQAFAHFMDGKVAAVVGSHSHVQTADERILPGGTAAITDVGMCGCYDSVIGIKKELSIEKFLTRRPVRYEPAEGPGGYGAVVIEVDEKNGHAKSIVRLREAVVH